MIFSLEKPLLQDNGRIIHTSKPHTPPSYSGKGIGSTHVVLHMSTQNKPIISNTGSSCCFNSNVSYICMFEIDINSVHIILVKNDK